MAPRSSGPAGLPAGWLRCKPYPGAVPEKRFLIFFYNKDKLEHFPNLQVLVLFCLHYFLGFYLLPLCYKQQGETRLYFNILLQNLPGCSSTRLLISAFHSSTGIQLSRVFRWHYSKVPSASPHSLQGLTEHRLAFHISPSVIS